VAVRERRAPEDVDLPGRDRLARLRGLEKRRAVDDGAREPVAETARVPHFLAEDAEGGFALADAVEVAAGAEDDDVHAERLGELDRLGGAGGGGAARGL